MLNRAPTVYVPVEPEDNGLAIPSIMSLIVHGSIIAFVLFANRIPTIHTPQTIETSIITPQELAEIQASISANRESMAAGSIASNEENPNTDQSTAKINLNSTDQPISTTSDKRHAESIFQRTNDPADRFDDSINSGQDNGFDPNYANELSSKRLEIEQTHEQLIRESEEETELKHRRIEEHFDQESQTQKDQVGQFKDRLKESSGNDNKQTGGRSIPDSLKNQSLNRTSSDSSRQTIELGNSQSSNSNASGLGSNSASSSAGNSSNAVKGALANHIKPYWNPPAGRIGKSVKVEIKVNANGDVLSVTANSDDSALNQSLEEAIRSASPLTPVIGTKHTTLRPTFKVTE